MTKPDTPVIADVAYVTISACSVAVTSTPTAPAIDARTQTTAVISVGLMIEVFFSAMFNSPLIRSAACPTGLN